MVFSHPRVVLDAAAMKVVEVMAAQRQTVSLVLVHHTLVVCMMISHRSVVRIAPIDLPRGPFARTITVNDGHVPGFNDHIIEMRNHPMVLINIFCTGHHHIPYNSTRRCKGFT